MLEGWASQQRTWFLKSATIDSRTRLIRRIAKFVNEYPWRWEGTVTLLNAANWENVA
jgi:hypothetical protein